MARQLQPFGVHTEASVAGLEDLRECLPQLLAQHGLVVVDGLADIRPRQLVHLMTAFGPEEQMLDYTSTPIDPEGISSGGGGCSWCGSGASGRTSAPSCWASCSGWTRRAPMSPPR